MSERFPDEPDEKLTKFRAAVVYRNLRLLARHVGVRIPFPTRDFHDMSVGEMLTELHRHTESMQQHLAATQVEVAHAEAAYAPETELAEVLAYIKETSHVPAG